MTQSAAGANLAQLLATGGRSFSFELFPPKTDEGEQALWRTVRDLERLNPTFVSVTYGAGGTRKHQSFVLSLMVLVAQPVIARFALPPKLQSRLR